MTTSMPLELYQTLEEEYVSMYGPLKRPTSDYTAADVLDLRWARSILRECGLPPVANEDQAAETLSGLVRGDDSLDLLANSPAIGHRGSQLLADYEELKALGDKTGGDSAVRELRRAIVDDAFAGAVRPLGDIRLDQVYAALHERAKAGKPRTALCISGGGIRSATFALGVLQGLASADILDQFDYLSTVSGGGYIGSWLSSWMRRHPRGATGVKEDLQRTDTAAAAYRPAGQDGKKDPTPRELPQSKIAPEPAPVRHLRDYSNYLSPRLGLLSGDTWTIASLYLRNLLLNLLILVPLLAFALSFPRIFSWLLQLSTQLDESHVWSPTRWAWTAAIFIAIGFAYIGWKRPVQQGKKAQKKARTVTTDGSFILCCVLPLAAAGTAMAVFWARVQATHRLDLLISPWTLGAAAFAVVFGMILLPFALYYIRVRATLLAVQRRPFADARERRADLWKKIGVELFAVLIAGATTAGLFWLLAKEVFDDPLRPVPLVETLAPIARAGQQALPQAQLYVCFAVPLVLLVFYVQASLFVGFSSFRNEDYDREWWGRAGAWLLATAAGLAALNAIAVFGPIAFYYAPVIASSLGGVAGLAAALLGFSGKTPATPREKEESGMPAKAGNLASVLTVPLFLVALLAAISLGSTWTIRQLADNPDILRPDQYARQALLQSRFSETEDAQAGLTLSTTPSPRVSLPALRAIAHLQTIQETDWQQALAFLILAGAAFALSFFIGVNKFSMHALYRNRIIRAYLGASRYVRDPDHFTGFDENDNVQMWELLPELLWASSIKDMEGLVAALKNGTNPLCALVWKELEPSTRDELGKPIDAMSRGVLVDNLNALLISADFGHKLREAGIQPPEWAAVKDGRIGHSHVLVHRAIFDAALADWVIPMIPPADAKDAKTPGNGLRRGPMHIVNIALNLTSGDNLAWQQRKAESFTVSPYHSGSLFLGYRPSREYGRGISLGTAVTISGAAASPNMGYHSSPVVAFLLTFFNIRLGSWLGNPGPYGQKTFARKHPYTGVLRLLEELTGNSTDRSRWVYLSDGGHFENLALYEMVVRRCHRIVLSDGGADPEYTFQDLGNAIRKIRTDLGIPIDIAKIEMAPRGKDGKPVTGEYVAFCTIRYSAVDKDAQDGQLVYIKPGVYKGEYFPWDVYNYSQESLQFPHEPTSDQFFSESQFESYRALGRHAINQICQNYPLPGAPEPCIPIAKTYASVGDFTVMVEELDRRARAR